MRRRDPAAAPPARPAPGPGAAPGVTWGAEGEPRRPGGRAEGPDGRAGAAAPEGHGVGAPAAGPRAAEAPDAAAPGAPWVGGRGAIRASRDGTAARVPREPEAAFGGESVAGASIGGASVAGESVAGALARALAPPSEAGPEATAAIEGLLFGPDAGLDPGTGGRPDAGSSLGPSRGPDPAPAPAPAEAAGGAAPARGSREILGWLWRGYLRRHWPALAVASLFMVAEGAALGLLSWMIEPMFDRVFVAGETGAIPWVGGAILAIFTLRALSSVIQRVLMTRVAQISLTEMQSDLVGHLMGIGAAFHRRMAPGAIMERIQGDTQAVLTVWRTLIQGAARDAVALVSLMAVALLIDPVWTLVALVGVPALVLPTVALQRYVRRKTAALRETAAQRSVRLSEIFHGIVPITLGGMQAYQRARFDRLVQGIVRAEVRMSAGRALLPALIDVMTGVGFVAVLVVGGRQVATGEKSLGEFMAFFTAMALAFQPLRKLGALAGLWQTAAASLDRLMALFEARPEVTPPARPVPLPQGAPEIRFEAVSFAYGEAPVLRAVSFAARAGRTTALVGPSGSGKSTALALVARLMDPAEGRVTWDGVPLAALDPERLRAAVSTVSQDAMLFDETIRENVTLGRAVSDAALRLAVEAAHVTEFAPFPHGLEAPAGVRGSALSGGQRQRVAIARAILRDTPVLLLDEATSALDARSEALVGEALARLAHGRTTIVIAHRLETIRAADHVVVLDRGRVADEGAHADLVARGGLYAQLLALRARDEAAEGGGA